MYMNYIICKGACINVQVVCVWGGGRTWIQSDDCVDPAIGYFTQIITWEKPLLLFQDRWTRYSLGLLLYL